MYFQKKFLFGKELVARHIITQDQLDEALIYHEKKNIRIGRALIELGYISESTLVQILADQLGITCLNVSRLAIPVPMRKFLTAEQAQRLSAIVIGETHDEITVCVHDPLDTEVMKELRRLIPKPLKVAVATEKEIADAVAQHYAVC